jgi:hypothetical protein
MNIYKLTRVAIGVALATASLSALAEAVAPPVPNPASSGANAIVTGEFLQSVPPTFNRAEQTGLCLMESVVSLLASRTNDFGCSGTYTLDVVTTDNQGEGFADLAGGAGIGGTTLYATLGPLKDIGTRCNVQSDGQAQNLINGLEVTYNGAHGWSRSNEIFNSDAYITIKDAQTETPNYYREVDIKDFFKQVLNGRSWEFDWGLEDIKKRRSEAGWAGDEAGFYYPVQKWQELSWYQHENGQEGGLWVHKYQMIPRSARGCRVEYQAYDLFNGSGEFETHGIVKVYKQKAGPI